MVNKLKIMGKIIQKKKAEYVSPKKNVEIIQKIAKQIEEGTYVFDFEGSDNHTLGQYIMATIMAKRKQREENKMEEKQNEPKCNETD